MGCWGHGVAVMPHAVPGCVMSRLRPRAATTHKCDVLSSRRALMPTSINVLNGCARDPTAPAVSMRWPDDAVYVGRRAATFSFSVGGNPALGNDLGSTFLRLLPNNSGHRFFDHRAPVESSLLVLNRTAGLVYAVAYFLHLVCPEIVFAFNYPRINRPPPNPTNEPEPVVVGNGALFQVDDHQDDEDSYPDQQEA